MTLKHDIKTLGGLVALRGFSRMTPAGQFIVLLAIASFIGPAVMLAVWWMRS